jgi:hypothetical protein
MPKFLIEIEDLVKKENVDDVYMTTPNPGYKYGERLQERWEREKKESTYSGTDADYEGRARFRYDPSVVSQKFIDEKEREENYENGFLKMTCGEAEGWHKQIQNGKVPLPAGIALAAIYHRKKCDKCRDK